ncbi:MAG: DUF420 domain-containing protein [Chitinophagaceae bacterium]
MIKSSGTGSSTSRGPLAAALEKNDKKAYWVIGIFSIVVFLAVVALGKFTVRVNLGFDPHFFAKMNAVINTFVSILLLAGLFAVKQRNFVLHKKLMISALILSVIFLVSYICHHLFTGDTKYGGTGGIRYVYFIILITHIFLAATVLPIILLTAYRALVAEWPAHRKLARITWPVWFYVSLTGVVVYLMISPYY